MSPQSPSSRSTRLAVLISGGGRSLENLVERCRSGELEAEVVLVISSNPRAGGVERCRRLDLPCFILQRPDFPDDRAFGHAVFDPIRAYGADLVVMAGWLKLVPIPPDFVGRVINIHPALLPDFGGLGMYGNRVHEAVLAAGRRESGCTVHFADDEYDRGPIILQKRCPVEPGDTPDTLAARVFELEREALPQAIRRIQRGEV